MALVPTKNEIKRHNVYKVHYKNMKVQMLSIELVSDVQSDNVIANLNGVVLDDHKLIAEFKHKLGNWLVFLLMNSFRKF